MLDEGETGLSPGHHIGEQVVDDKAAVRHLDGARLPSLVDFPVQFVEKGVGDDFVVSRKELQLGAPQAVLGGLCR